MDRKAELRTFSYDYLKEFLDKDKQIFVECIIGSFLPMAIIGIKNIPTRNPFENGVHLLVQDARPRWIKLSKFMSIYTYVTPIKRKPRQKKVYNWGTFDPQISYVESPWMTSTSTSASTEGITWRRTP